MPHSHYPGPPVFGYETDLPVRRAAMICVHTSPLAELGSKDAGGMNVYVRQLACHLADLGIAVDIFTRRADPETPQTVECCPGVRVVSVAAGPPEPIDKNDLFSLLPGFAAEVALYSVREGVRYDVVHSHYWLSGWVAHLLRRYWDTPFVQMFHTTAHMKNAVAAAADRETALRLRTERQLIDLADSLIAANPAERADLVWRQRTSTDKVCTVPPGVDLALFNPGDSAQARRDLGLAPDAKVALFVGRIDPIKGIDTLLDAAKLLADGGSDDIPTILFVGGDLDRSGQPIGALAEVAAAAETLGIRNLFRFEGSRPQPSLPTYYRAADLVVVPSRYESFGLVAVEAMACGTPVVVSRAGGLAFTVEDGVGGLIVPARDPAALASAVRRVLADDALRADLARGAQETAQRFSWPAVAAQISHVYARLATGHRADLCCDDEIFA